jgi:tetratricopeptide (TPR) repeat protein
MRTTRHQFHSKMRSRAPSKPCLIATFLLRSPIQMAEKNGHHLWAVHFGLETAWMYEQACAFEGARVLCEQGLKHAREVQYGYGLLLSLILLGFAHLGLKQYERAFQCFSEAIHQGESERSMLDWILQMQLRHGLSEYWLAQRAFGRARQEAERLCELAAQPGERTYLALGWRTLADIALAEQQWKQADADHYWLQSATILNRLADSLGDAIELRQSLLTHLQARVILRCTRTGA